MKSPRHFGKVFWVAMATVCLVFWVVAGCAVIVYGDVDNGSITAYILKNFTDHRDMILIANTFVSVSVLLTYPLQLFPCSELVGAWVEQKRRRGLEPLSAGEENEVEKDSLLPGDSPLLRLGLVMLTYVVAIVIPNVQQLISLAGALCGSSTALIIPPLLELESVRRTTNRSSLSIAKCYVSFFFGIVFCLIGSGASIVNIIRLYMQK
jgi:proton-coupled amino acid transporter